MLKHLQGLLGSLPLGRKLTLMALLLLAPTVVVGALFYSSQEVQLAAARGQLDALEYSRPFVRLLTQLGAHRDSAALAMAGIGGSEPVRGAQAEVDRALRAAKATDAASGERFRTQALMTEIVEGWEGSLKPNWNTGSATVALDMHTLVMAQVSDAIRLAGRVSRAPESGPGGSPFDFSLLFALPQSLESLGQLGAFGVGLSRQQETAPEQWDRLASLSQDVRRNAEALRSTAIAAGKSPADARLKTAADAAVTAAESLLDATQDAAARRDAFRADPSAYRAQTSLALSALASLETLLAERVETDLRKRLAELTQARNFELVAVGLMLAMALGLGYWIAETVSRQLTSMASVFKRIDQGDLAARAEVIAADELGSFAQALNRVLDNTIALVQSRAERDSMQADVQKLSREMEGVAQGDLTQEAAVSRETTGAIAESFNFMLVELRGLIRRVQESARTVDLAAAGVRETTAELADGSQAQAAQIVQATAAVNQMVESVQHVTGQAATAAQIAQAALRNAQMGSESARLTIDGMGQVRKQVQDTAQLVHELGESSAQIGDITKLIADISKRTSILALNASIQAAVAGQSGKGFGVVAGQVEELAARSSEAVRRVAALTKSIQGSTANVIEAMQQAIDEATSGERLATEASRRLVEIEGVSRQLAGVVETILGACRQQGSSSESIAQSMGEISRVTQRNTSGTQEAATLIGDLASLVQELRGSVSRFRLPA